MTPDIELTEAEYLRREDDENEELSWHSLCESMGEKAWRSSCAPNLNEEDKDMPSINDVYGGNKGLKAADLNGRSHALEINDVELVKFNDGAKLVIGFSGREKRLVLNKVNSTMIASRYGDDYTEWQGAKIEVYPDKTQFNGSLVDCIRIRIPVPAATADDGTIPF